MMKTQTLLALCMIPILAGCAADLSGAGSKASLEPQSFSLDGVKWISPEVQDGNDPRSYTQSSYVISPNGRLLLRLEGLQEKAGDISLAENRKVTLAITLEPGENEAAARTSLRLCPMQKNWMMLATWRMAYPMGRSGAWAKDGGDYDASLCISALPAETKANTKDKAANSTAAASTPKTLNFDLTPWIVDEVRGRSRNLGLILLSENGGTVRVSGDANQSYSPRVSWMKYIPPTSVWR